MKNYNTTDLDPEAAFERHVFHRDYFAHYLRWTYVLNTIGIGDRVCDFGCGKGNLLEVLYRNKHRCSLYFGMDIRSQTIEKNKQKFSQVKWAGWLACDLVNTTFKFEAVRASHVCSFEVIEHVGKQNVPKFLENFKRCGAKNATYYLSTPNYDPVVGAAGNHTYDSGDGRGVDVQELYHSELQKALDEAGFEVIKKYGTFASQRDYLHLLTPHQLELFEQLKEYYSADLLAVIFAPLFPEDSRNTMWVLKTK